MRVSFFLLLLLTLLQAEDEVQPLRVGTKAGETWTSSRGIVFVWCPKGELATNREGRPLKIRIEEGFWLGKYEVTKAQFDQVTFKKPRASIATARATGKAEDDVSEFIAQPSFSVAMG